MSFPSRRLRRLRSSEKMRELMQETVLSPSDFICPVFVQEGLDREPRHLRVREGAIHVF